MYRLSPLSVVRDKQRVRGNYVTTTALNASVAERTNAMLSALDTVVCMKYVLVQ